MGDQYIIWICCLGHRLMYNIVIGKQSPNKLKLILLKYKIRTRKGLEQCTTIVLDIATKKDQI